MELGQLPGWRRRDVVTRAFVLARERDLLLALRARRRAAFGVATVRTLRPTDRALLPRDQPRTSPACPHCPSQRVHRWGRFGTPSRQRWKCLGCSRTFSDLTGTLLSRTRKLAAWIAFAEHLRRVPTVRAAAEAVGVNKDTALRWRHRMLDALAETERIGTGPASARPGPDLTLLMSIPLVGRPARLEPGNRPTAFVAWVLLGAVPAAPGLERTLARPTFARVVEVRRQPHRLGTLPVRPGLAVFQAMARAPVWSKVVTAPRGEMPMLALAARERGWKVLSPSHWNARRLAIRRLVRGLWRFRGQFSSWKARFRGIAPENLTRYLNWFGVLGGYEGAWRVPFSRVRVLLDLGLLRRADPGPGTGAGTGNERTSQGALSTHDRGFDGPQGVPPDPRTSGRG
jgi:transposase-like protein